nr:MAG TPA: Neck appendage protein [Bacteriophage sp.]
MSSHIELNPDDDVLGLSLGMKAMRLALSQKTHRMGTVRIPVTGGTDVIIGVGASDGANRIDQDGRQLPLVDTSGIDKAAQDAQQAADKAMAKADEAIAKGEQIRQDAQAGIDDARKQAQDAAAKTDKVRSDLTRQVQDAKSEMDSTVKAAQSSANKAQSAADAAQKAADKANASTADLDKSIKAVDAKAIAAKQAAAEAQSKAENVASDLDSANAVIEQHTTELGELTTKVSNAVKKSDSALSVSTEAKQTATEASTTASSAYKDSQTALTQSTTATQTAAAAKTTAESASKTATDSLKQSSAAVQTANQISTTLRTEYQTKADADKIYATQSSLKQTSDSITASVSKTYATKDALSSLQNAADNAIESWRGTGAPTLTNKPASDWTTDADKKKHSGDLYYDKSTGKAYRFGSDDGRTYTWELNQDTDVTKALADASKAQTSANNAQASATAANTAAGKAQSTANTAVSNAATAKNAADAAQSSANKAQGDVDKLKIDIPETYATKSSLTQTAESITANVESVKTTANSAVTAASKAQQTADGISVNLSKNYQTKSQADVVYATRANLKATSESISAEVTKAQGTADGAVTAASKAQQTADAVTLNLSKNYQTKAQNDALYATQTSLKATSDSLSAKITANAKTAQSAVDKATSLEANLNGFKTTVSQTYTTKTDFDNLTVGGTNLLVKSNFIKTWLDTVNGTLIHPDASVSGSEYNGDSSSKKPITVDPNTTYVLSAYDSMTDTVANTGRISQFDSEGTFINFVVPGIDLRDKGHITFTTDENAASILVGIYSFPRYRWKLEKGTKPTDWSPAPEDLQPAGDYATNSSLTQTANSIKAQVTEVSKTANSAMSKVTTVEQTANGLSSKITEQAKTLNATVRTANEAKSTADSNKTTISQVSTTASDALSKASTVEQDLNGFKTTVANTYQPKSGMGSYATTSQLTQTANQIRGEVSEKYQSKDGMSSYATTSALTQKADEITGKVTEVAKTAQGNTTTISQVSQKVDRINTTLSQKIDGKADTSRVSSLEQSLDGFKTSVAKTYQEKGDYPTKTEMRSSISQSASSIKTEVANTYTTQAATETLRKSAARSFNLYGANGTGPKWVKLGYLVSNGDSSSVLLHVYSGDGYSGQARQNAEFEIFVKDGWQGALSVNDAFGVSVKRIRNADNVKVKVLAFSSNTCDIWVYLPWMWWNGYYTLQGNYNAWTDGPNTGGNRIQDDEPNGTVQDIAYDTLSTHSYVDQTAKSVALGVVQNYRGADGSGLATKSDITASEKSITSTVAGTYATKSGVTQEISSKITQNNNSLDVKFATKTDVSGVQSDASDAQSRVGVLEDCIKLTSEGVRAGHQKNGVFDGVSALVNTDGSFDLLDKDGNLLTRIGRHGLQVAGDDGVGSGHLILSQDGLDITVRPTANKTVTYHIRLGAGGISITAPDGAHINCSARTGLDLETVRYGKLAIGPGGLQFTNDQGWGLALSVVGWSLKWAGNHQLATGSTAGKLYIDGHEIVTK